MSIHVAFLKVRALNGPTGIVCRLQSGVAGLVFAASWSILASGQGSFMWRERDPSKQLFLFCGGKLPG